MRIRKQLRCLTWILLGTTLFIGCSHSNRATPDSENEDWQFLKASAVETERSFPDSALVLAFKMELDAQPDVMSEGIAIAADNGIISLQGSVDNLLQKEKTIQVAQAMKGVRGVIDRLTVKKSNIPDKELLVWVRQALVLDPVVESFEVTPSVVLGEVVLEGSVESIQEKRFAEEAVKGVKGVRNIRNEIEIIEADYRPDEEIEEEINSVFNADIRIDNSLIQVRVSDNTAYLSGVVGSLSEKTRAEYLANVQDITSVDSKDLAIANWARNEKLRKNKYTFKSDIKLEQAIRDAFLYDPRINRYDIMIQVRDGIATLTGDVAFLGAKDAAEQTAQNIVGVWEVENLIRITPPSKLGQAKIEEKVTHAFHRDPYLDAYEIASNLEEGKLVLTGWVDSYFEKNRAERISSMVPGIQQVSNEITVRNKQYYPIWYDYYSGSFFPQDAIDMDLQVTKTDSAIAHDVQQKFFWSPYVNEEEIAVSVENGRVTLTGAIQTYREKQYAEKNAYEAGAISVENDLFVNYGPKVIE